MKNTVKRIAAVVPFVATIALPLLAGAQFTPTTPVTTTTQLASMVNRIAGILQWGLIVLAGVFGIFAGYLYLTAAGDEGKIGKAKNLLIYTVIALAIGLLAGGIGSLTVNFLGVTAPTP